MNEKKRILAVASGGGHWIQLRRLREAFRGGSVTYVTTLRSYQRQFPDERFLIVRDANRDTPLNLAFLALKMLWIVLKEWPDVVVSTGAAPGYFAVRFGRLIGAKTIWVDSMANAEQLSSSGQAIRRHADLWLTQWPHLAAPEGPHYEGAVL